MGAPAEADPFDLSDDQRRAIDAVMLWFGRARKQNLTMGGYAGTGKTTIVKQIVATLGDRVRVCAFTGKAAYVLRQKGVSASTVHRLIYEAVMVCLGCGHSVTACSERREEKRATCTTPGAELQFHRVPELGCELVIVDEASMLNRRLMEDLESFGTQVLYVGDHGQLQPIGDDPGLMADPEVRLETIHRQAVGTPHLEFAHHVRRGGSPLEFDLEGPELTIARAAPQHIDQFDVVLCGYNKTRCAVNRKIRRRLGFEGSLPQEGERVICLRNNADLGIFNGMLATVKTVHAPDCYTFVDDLGMEFPKVVVSQAQFGAERTDQDVPRDIALFDFGYALTTHKSQGSEFDRVCVLEQIASSWSPERWRYTAASRAAKHLTYCKR